MLAIGLEEEEFGLICESYPFPVLNGPACVCQCPEVALLPIGWRNVGLRLMNTADHNMADQAVLLQLLGKSVAQHLQEGLFHNFGCIGCFSFCKHLGSNSNLANCWKYD